MQLLFLGGGFMAICCMLTTKEQRAEGRATWKPIGRALFKFQAPGWLLIAVAVYQAYS